jgi:hypothetical protein
MNMVHVRILILGFLCPYAGNETQAEAAITATVFQALIARIPVLGSFITMSVTPVAIAQIQVPTTTAAITHPTGSTMVVPGVDPFAGTSMSTQSPSGE